MEEIRLVTGWVTASTYTESRHALEIHDLDLPPCLEMKLEIFKDGESNQSTTQHIQFRRASCVPARYFLRCPTLSTSMILFLDTETTGLPPEPPTPTTEPDAWPRIVEMGWQTYSTDRQQLARNALLVRPDGFEIPDEAVDVHGITTQEARDSGKEITTVLKTFKQALEDVDVIVAHNARFDLGVLLAEFYRAGIDTSLADLPVICTMRSAVEFCRHEGTTTGNFPSLGTLYEALTDRSPTREHRAGADVQTLVSCFWKLVSRDVVSPEEPGPSAKAAGRTVGEAGLDESPAEDSTLTKTADIPIAEERPSDEEGGDNSQEPAPQEGFVIDEVYEHLQSILRDLEGQEDNGSSESESEADERIDQKDESPNVLDVFYSRIGRFYAKGLPMTAPPDPVDSTLAVAYNYLCRGRPTRASLRLSEWMLDYYVPEAGSTVREDATIEITTDSSFWNGVDAEALRDALEAPLSGDLSELAARIGQRPLRLLRLSRSLVHAAHIQIVIVWALLQRGDSVAEYEEGEEFSVHVEGMDVDVAQVVCDDLTALLGHLTTLRFGNEASCLHVRAVEEPANAHLTARGPWRLNASEVGSASLDGGADGLADRQVELVYPDDRAAGKKQQWRKRRMFADRISYASVGEVQRVQRGDREVQQFDVQDEDRHAALTYVLRNAFRKEGFWAGQQAIINRALQCKDVIGLLPTGGGKSLAYQLCGLLQPGTTVVVDPINSLMQDQYDKLCEEWLNASDYINSFYSRDEKQSVRSDLTAGKLQFLFVAPERLQMPRYRETFEGSLRNGVRFSYGVVDEAHCVSEWGHDFRHVYLHLADNLQRFCTGRLSGPFEAEDAEQEDERLPLFGLTATASFDVLADVQRELRMGEDAIITLPAEAIDRDELSFQILPVDAEVEDDAEFYERERQLSWSKYAQVEAFIRSVPSELQIVDEESDAERATDLDTFLAPNEEGQYENAGVIFCPTKSPKLENGVLALRDGPKGESELKGLRKRMPQLEITTFFGGQDNETVKDSFVEKEASKSLNNQRRFIRDQANLMIATKAFGMGIDKPNLRFTLHYTLPSSVENFYQEAGRAGRDGDPALCGILYHPQDIETNHNFQQNSFKGIGREKAILTELLEEVQYEDRFFVRQLERGVREESNVYVRLNLFPTGEGEEPFLLYVNGEWHDDPAERVCFGCLHLDGLRPFKTGKYRKNTDPETANRVLETTRTVLERKSDTSNYAEYLTRVQTPGILPRLRDAGEGEVHELEIGFTSDTVQEMTAKLEETGKLGNEKRYKVKDEVVRAAYNFSQDAEDFIDRLEFQYKKYFDYSRELSLDKETEAFFRSHFPKIRNPTDTQRALYRLSILGVIDDYDIDYAGQVLNVRFQGKSEQSYRDRLERYFRRYLGEDSTEEWLSRVDEHEERSTIKQCLWIQTKFVYKEIARKRKRAIEYMDSLCQEGIERGEKHFRQSIVYYFTSKYARDEYLQSDLDQGKVESLEVVDTYIDYVFNPPNGLGGQIDNAKHLRGACARLQTSLTGENAVIDVLTAFSVLVLNSVGYEEASGSAVEPSEEAITAYRRGFRSFKENPSTSWRKLLDTMDKFHRRLSEISSAMEEAIRTERDAFLVTRTTERLSNLNHSLGVQ